MNAVSTHPPISPAPALARRFFISTPSGDPATLKAMKTEYLALALVGAFVVLWPNAEAVVPPPDGAYPNGNTAEGQNALLNLTSGRFNAAVGWLSLRNLSTGNFNTAVGAGTLALNTAEENTATGTGALLFNTGGIQNTANGAFALFNNDIGNFNTAIGFQALFGNTDGLSNTAVGVQACRITAMA